MDEMYGFHSGGDYYVDKALMSPENMMMPGEYSEYHYSCPINSGGHHHRNIPMFGSDELGFQCSHDSASVNVQNQRDEDEEDSSVIKAKIASHPSYAKLLDAYIDCQKVGAPPEIVSVLDEIRREKDLCKHKHDAVSMCTEADPQLDEFMVSLSL